MELKIDIEIKNDINKKVYLLFGDENYLVKKYKNKIIDKLMPRSELLIYDGEKTSASNIIDACEVISFNGEKRIVLVTDSNLLYKGKSHDIDMLTSFINDDFSDYVIIFVESKVDKRSKLYKSINKNGFVQEFNLLKNIDISKFIINEVKKLGSNISNDNARYLSIILHNNLENVLSEVEKLCSYKINDTITKSDIDLICSKSLEIRVFELVDKIGQKNAKIAIQIFNNMILTKESPLMILTMIGKSFKTILLCKTLLENGYLENEIVAKTKLHSFVVKKNIAIAKNFRKKQLYDALFEVLDADEKIKTGQIKDTIAVENIILKYSSKEV